ncbi:hypothetical protein B7463_g8679, partial [Scytalidium lignicola]
MLRAIGKAQNRRGDEHGLYNASTRSTSSIGPRKAFRIILRVVLWSAISWLILALPWAFLPFPGAECDVSCVTSVLDSGGRLTRVYRADAVRQGNIDRMAFALDYTLSSSSAHLQGLVISGLDEELPLYNPDLKAEDDAESSRKVQIAARLGDTDGANLPWFHFADSVLLFW